MTVDMMGLTMEDFVDGVCGVASASDLLENVTGRADYLHLIASRSSAGNKSTPVIASGRGSLHGLFIMPHVELADDRTGVRFCCEP